MERVDLVSVALMWCVGLSALIQAINARGHFRIALSWLLVAAIFVVAVFFSSLKAIDIRNLFSTDGPIQSVLQTQPARPGESGGDRPPPRHSPPGANAVDADSLFSAYRAEVARLLKEARACAESVQAFPAEANLQALSAPKYEKEESRARALRNQSSNLHRQLINLRSPEPWSEFHDDLVVSLENLRLAGYEVHALFGADEDVSVSDLRAQAQKHAKLATSGITDAELRLDKLKP